MRLPRPPPAYDFILDVRRLDDPSAFLADAAPLLLADEARHNLILGLAATLEQQPRIYREYRFWLIEADGRPLAAAMQTPPYNLLVARPEDNDALEALVAALHAEQLALPGVTGSVPEVDTFAGSWERRSGRARRVRMRQRIYRLETVRPVTGVRGSAREATNADRELLVSWVQAFMEETWAGVSIRTPEDTVDARLRSRIGGFVLWEDEAPVSLAGWGGPTPNGIRIGPVYTPLEQRRRGYASAVTASVSADQLASGRRFCFLYTDIANPTSNRIYTEIGYEPVCESVDYVFESPKRRP